MKAETRLILALDVLDYKKAVEHVAKLQQYLDAVKINYPLVLASPTGIGIVHELAKYIDIICDFKIADIPYTNKLIVSKAIEAGATGIIVHGFIGSDAVRTVVETAKPYNAEVFVVVEMTHAGATEYIQPVCDKLVKLATEVGADGVIAPGTQPERVRHIRSLAPELKILAPGVGAQGGSAQAVIKAGADYLIVGRSIYNSESPEKMAKYFITEIKTAINARAVMKDA